MYQLLTNTAEARFSISCAVELTLQIVGKYCGYIYYCLCRKVHHKCLDRDLCTTKLIEIDATISLPLQKYDEKKKVLFDNCNEKSNNWMVDNNVGGDGCRVVIVSFPNPLALESFTDEGRWWW